MRRAALAVFVVGCHPPAPSPSSAPPTELTLDATPAAASEPPPLVASVRIFREGGCTIEAPESWRRAPFDLPSCEFDVRPPKLDPEGAEPGCGLLHVWASDAVDAASAERAAIALLDETEGFERDAIQTFGDAVCVTQLSPQAMFREEAACVNPVLRVEAHLEAVCADEIDSLAITAHAVVTATGFAPP